MALTKKQTIRAISQYQIKDKKLRREFSDIGYPGGPDTWAWDYKKLDKLQDFELDLILIKAMKAEKLWAVDAAWHGKELP